MFPLSGQNKPDIDGAEELRGEISVGRHRPRAWEHPQTSIRNNTIAYQARVAKLRLRLEDAETNSG